MRCIWLACVLLLAAMTEPVRAAPPVEAYGRLPGVSNLSLSPSGKRAAFLVSNASGRRIAVQEVDGKVLATLDPGDLKLADIAWAGDDFLLVTTSATINLAVDWGRKHELERVQVVDLRTLKTIIVFGQSPKDSTVVEGAYGVAQKGGRWYGYFGGASLGGGGNLDLYEVDLATGAAHVTAEGGERSHNWVVGPDGKVIAHTEYDQSTGNWRLLVGPTSGGREVMARRTPLHEMGLIGQGRVLGSVLVVDGVGDELVYEEVALADGKAQPLLTGETVTAMIFDQGSGLLLGAQVRGPAGAVLFDPAREAKVRGAFKAFPGRRAQLLAYDPSFDEMIVMTDGGDDAGTYWYVDIPGHKALPLGTARPDLPSAEVGLTRMVPYKAADGLEMEGVLTLPRGREAKGLPLVVMPHGGPLGERDDIGFDWWAQAYASRGYAVFQPNYRGSGGYGRDFERKGYGEWGRKMLSDMSDGVAALAAEGVVDPKRACIVGGSYGGYAALAGVTLQHGLYRCAVAVAGVADMPALRRWDLDRQGEGDNEMQRAWRTAIQGEGKDEPSLAAISPARLAGRADSPVLLVHGTDDTVVPIEQSRKMESALKAAGKSVTLIVIKGQDHWLTNEDGRVQMLKAAVDFVLKNDPPN